MDIAQRHRASMVACREFVTAGRNTVHEARQAVSASRERMILSDEMINDSAVRLARCEQRIIDMESDRARHWVTAVRRSVNE